MFVELTMNGARFCLCISLLSGACFTKQPQPRTFLVNNIHIPDGTEPEEIGFDFDGDGEIDNGLESWARLWESLGFDPQQKFNNLVASGDFLVAFDLYQFAIQDDLLFGYRAVGQGVPRFDGTDQVEPLSSIFPFETPEVQNTKFQTSAPFFEWALIPFDSGEVLTLPLENVHVSAILLDNSLTQGQLSGTLPALATAKILEEIPRAFEALQFSEATAFNNGLAPISCDGSDAVCVVDGVTGFCPDQLADGVSNGFCVATDSTTELAMSVLDADGDGLLVVDFDEGFERFNQNDLALLFDFEPGQDPSGIFGNLYDLDTDADGVNDAMGVGVGFGAVSANPR